MIDPAWALVVGPAIGVAGFFVAKHWPVESEDGRNGMGVPDLQVRPLGGLSPNPQTDQETEEEQEMSSTNEAFTRAMALEKAINFVGREADSDEIIKVAEQFRAFMAGETAAEPKPELPLFVLPKDNDGYVYYEYVGTAGIFYRSSLLYGAEAGGVDRISTNYPNRNWARQNDQIGAGTLRKLQKSDDYQLVPPYKVAGILRQYHEGTRRFK